MQPDEIDGGIQSRAGTLLTSQYGPGDGINLHYVRQGAGPPVLLLHGWPGSWYDWRDVIPHVTRFADVIAPDLRGFGSSEAPDESPAAAYQPDHFAADVIALIRSLEIGPVTIAAYDIGATIAQRIALIAPDLVSALVLAAPPYGGIGTRRFEPAVQGAFWYQHFHQLELATELVTYNRKTLKMYLRHFYDRWSGDDYTLPDDELETLVESYARPGRFASSIQWYRARQAARMSEAAASHHATIELPTTILWGARDPVMRVEWSDRLSEYFAHYTLHVLERAGHFVPLEAPDALANAIRMLLTQTNQERA